MKVATGNWINIYSEQGHDNYGFKLHFDIMVLFIESFQLTPEVADAVYEKIQERLIELGKVNPFAQKNAVKTIIIEVLDSLGYEYERVLVDQYIR